MLDVLLVTTMNMDIADIAGSVSSNLFVTVEVELWRKMYSRSEIHRFNLKANSVIRPLVLVHLSLNRHSISVVKSALKQV